MHTIQFGAGEHIEEAAQKLVTAAHEHGSACGTFNDILLTAKDGDTLAGILAAWRAESKARAEAYAASPEGIKAARDAADRRTAAQWKHDALMDVLPRLDFSDDTKVLDWLCEMQDPSDHVGVAVDKKAILDAFAAHGFLPGVNCGEDFNGADRDNMHRWLVGQALSTLQSVAIHGIIHKFADEWRTKFLGKAA